MTHISKIDQVQQLAYVRSMLRELRQIADAEQADMLSYMIEMAYIECSDIISGQRPKKVMPSIKPVDQ